MKSPSAVAVTMLLGTLLAVVCPANAFNPTHRVCEGTHRLQQQLKHADRTLQREQYLSFLLDEFQTADGDLLNAYKILHVDRTADEMTITKSFRKLSWKYNVHEASRRDILPGSCNNLDDVRRQWEVIQQAYTILVNPELRKRYDHLEALAHPGEALARAALEVLGKGLQDVTDVSMGLFRMGASVMQQMLEPSTAHQYRHHHHRGGGGLDIHQVNALSAALGLEQQLHRPEETGESHMWMEVGKEKWVQVPV